MTRPAPENRPKVHSNIEIHKPGPNSFPTGRTHLEVTSIRHILQNTLITPIDTSIRNLIAPPIQRLGLVLDRKEDYQRRERQSNLERRRERQCVLLPPARVPLLDVHIEQETKGQGGSVVRKVVGHQPENAVQEGRDVDLAHPAIGEALCQEVEGDRQESTPEEAVQGRVVDAVGEEPLRTDGTPDDRGSEEDGCTCVSSIYSQSNVYSSLSTVQLAVSQCLPWHVKSSAASPVQTFAMLLSCQSLTPIDTKPPQIVAYTCAMKTTRGGILV